MNRLANARPVTVDSMDSTSAHSARPTLRANLSVKLLVAFGVVVLVAVGVVAVFAGQSAEREFSRFLKENQAEPPAGLVDQLADLYTQHGDWTGAEDVIVGFATETSDQTRTPPVILVDTEGNYVASNWTQRLMERVLDAALADGWPVQVNGETVGTLILPGFPRPPEDVLEEGFSPEGVATVGRVQQAIFIAGLSAGALGLALAGVLAWRLVRPLRRLTDAADGIARGDLTRRVPVTSHDEVGELTTTFNHMAAELERAEMLRRNMTADVAHELRTPLSVIRGKLEGVLDGVYPATREHLRPVLEATEVLTYLVEDLRLLAQAEAGQLNIEKRTVDIGDLLQDTHVNFEPQASDQDVTLVLDLPSSLPQVKGDWHRITQVLSNLITNALRHTPEGGCVNLSAAAGDGIVKVAVADTGTGISSEDLPV